MDADSEGIPEVLESSDEEEEAEPGSEAFGLPTRLFVVAGLKSATSGFRPAVVCEGHLAELQESPSGYSLKPLGSLQQQLSFKFEPPSPKFSRKRPQCLSYRLQLLQGSSFLYSLRGLPTSLRCQRAARALEWGPVHVVFAVAADLETFLATLKYVAVEAVEEAAPPERGRSGGGAGGGGEPEGGQMPWAVAAAKLWMAGGGTADAPEAPPATRPPCNPSSNPPGHTPYGGSYNGSYTLPLVATAAALSVAAAAYLMVRRTGTRRGGGSGAAS